MESNGRVTCVLADDHDAVRSAVRDQLDRVAWVEVLGEATDGAEATSLIAELQPDVAIVDIRMPSRTGYEVCTRLMERDVATKVILYSALADDASVTLGLQSGAAAVIAKQDGFAALRAELERHRTPNPDDSQR